MKNSINLTLTEELLKKLEEETKVKGYTSKQECVRAILREKLLQKEVL